MAQCGKGTWGFDANGTTFRKPPVELSISCANQRLRSLQIRITFRLSQRWLVTCRVRALVLLTALGVAEEVSGAFFLACRLARAFAGRPARNACVVVKAVTRWW